MKKIETVRLERGDGNGRVFWEITRARAVLTTRFGRIGSAGRTVVKELEDPAAAERAFAKSIADKRKEGYADPAPRLVVGGSAKKGVSARNAELEAAIDAQPDDPQGYLVYADWLQQHGDARGELVVIQHGRSVDRGSAELERAEAALIARYQAELLGPLARYTHVRTADRSHKGLAWRWGFVRAARLRRISETKLSDIVRTLLSHPSGRFIERLALGRPWFGDSEEADLSGVFDVLAAHAPKTLTWLCLGDGATAIGDIGGLWTAMPRLRHLFLEGAVERLGDVRADALEELHVAVADRPTLERLAAARWPRVRRLHLTIVTVAGAPEAALASLLAPAATPSLERLSVRRWMESEAGAPIPYDALALDVARIAAARALAALDLDVPLTDAGARALLAGAAGLARASAIAIPRAAVDAEPLRAALSSRVPRLAWGDPPIEQPPGDLEPLDDALYAP